MPLDFLCAWGCLRPPCRNRAGRPAMRLFVRSGPLGQKREGIHTRSEPADMTQKGNGDSAESPFPFAFPFMARLVSARSGLLDHRRPPGAHKPPPAFWQSACRNPRPAPRPPQSPGSFGPDNAACGNHRLACLGGEGEACVSPALAAAAQQKDQRRKGQRRGQQSGSFPFHRILLKASHGSASDRR